MEKTKGRYPAALAILDLFERTLDKDISSGLEEEARAFSKLAITPISKNLIGLFYS
jgi:3-hydroxyacyl-CoA dehydrogenase/enoyl-CoA hydratase/3-hydroxybutyryl-CoA epimerase